MIAISQLSALVPYSLGGFAGAAFAAHTSLQTPLTGVIPPGVSTNAAAAVYDLALKLFEKEREDPCVTLAGRVMDRILKFFSWKREAEGLKLYKRGVQAEAGEDRVQKESETDIQKKPCPGNEAILFEMTNCHMKLSNECLCLQFPLGCTREFRVINGSTRLTKPIYYYTTRVYAFGANENGCTVPIDTKNTLLRATQTAILIAGGEWQDTGAKANASIEFPLPELDGTSWKVILSGEQELNEEFIYQFNMILQYIMHLYTMNIQEKRTRWTQSIIVYSSFGTIALIASIIGVSLLIRRNCKAALKQSDDEIALLRLSESNPSLNKVDLI